MPSRKIRDRTERRPGSEDFGVPPQHQERHMAAARASYDVDARRVNVGMTSGIVYGIDDILNGVFRSAGNRLVVRASKIRPDKRPPQLFRMIQGRRIMVRESVVAAPGVEPYDKRHSLGLGCFRRPEVTRLLSPVKRRTHIDEHGRPFRRQRRIDRRRGRQKKSKCNPFSRHRYLKKITMPINTSAARISAVPDVQAI